MAIKRIILTGPMTPAAHHMLETVAEVKTAPPGDAAALAALAGAATIGLVARGAGQITQALIDACPDLRVIGRTGAGYDTVDVPAATRRGIPVVYAPVNAFAVAEAALAMLMALVKRIPFCDDTVKAGHWERRVEFTTGDMAGNVLGIIGLGRTGAHLARLVQNFDMTVLGHDPEVGDDQAAEMGVQLTGLDDLLGRSDFVSLHVPLMDGTRGLISQARLALMKDGAILVNTSRGAVVESLDVLGAALESGKLEAVALDVFPDEPPDVTHPIFQHPNFLAAPHMAGVSALAWERICRATAQGMIDVLDGRPPPFCVNPDVLP